MNDPLSFSSLSLISSKLVPNVFPTISVPYRLAIIGEAPGADEETYGVPFVGASGKLLDSLLSSTGILRAGCYVGNCCQYRPPGNDITEFGYGHDKVLEGVAQLRADLAAFSPHCVLLLGNTPLHFAANLKGSEAWNASIISTFFGKAVVGIHPASVLREYKQWKLLQIACRRAREEAEFPELRLPQRTLELDLSVDEICYRLDNWPAGALFSFDIEGGLDAFPCCSVAGESNRGFIVGWSKFSDTEQGRIAVSLSRALYSKSIPKVLQNSLYDRFVLAYGYNMLIRNVVEDTMDKQWALLSELPKGLGTICQIWTREPNYKTTLMIYGEAALKRKVKEGYNPHEAQENKYKGCILDSCVTLEASLAMSSAMSEKEERSYRFNVSLKDALLYMQLRGLNYDRTLCDQELAQVNLALAECAARIESKVQPMQFTKTEFSSCIRGKKGSISDKRLPKVLYEQKGYPVQKKGRGLSAKVTCDVEALLNLKKKKPSDPFLTDILRHRKLEGVRETLEWDVDPKDGRMKCSYNQFSKGDSGAEEGGGATETGRLRCSKSLIPTEEDTVGGNLQTVTKKLRKLYRADPGYWLFQCDLAGADGWTVAARCLSLGDSTMWDDYQAGLKPARIVALMYHQGVSATLCSREELKERCKLVDPDSWLYFACKRIQHGTNYGMQEKTMSVQIMKDSYNITGDAVYIEPSVCATLQRLYLSRYPGIYQWHLWAKKQVFDGQNLTSASGHTRIFLGRRKSWDPKTRSVGADHETWKEFLADEPQENTTFATNMALHKLWHDPENRTGFTPRNGVRSSIHGLGLHIEPLHQVHDALIGQFPKEKTTWAVEKIRTYFQNELLIANIKVTIPFEGAYGPNWSMHFPECGWHKNTTKCDCGAAERRI